MITKELLEYIKRSLDSSLAKEEIFKKLQEVGWSETDIIDAFIEVEDSNKNKSPHLKKTPFTKPWLDIILIIFIFILSGLSFYLWQSKTDLSKTNKKAVRDFYTRLSESQISFTDTKEMVFPDEQKFLTKKLDYIKTQQDFIEINLQTMVLTLYKNGMASSTFKVLTKGKEGSWWETPTGDYKVLAKSINAYSSIGNVYMPYSLQFYGNYLIHGWPYYENGSPVPQGYSGGCIRLSTRDAKEIFNFATVNMPVLVLENYSEHNFGFLDMNSIKTDNLPKINARSFLVADLSSGDVILEKNAHIQMPIASLVKLMTGVVAHEIIYLGRTITVTPSMMANISQIFNPRIGEHYIGLDLLYPLLMQSSNEVANILASFIGLDAFIKNMNLKAESLQMTNTNFTDPSGISAENISTAKDLSRLLQYIYYKRPFLFDISRGVDFNQVGIIKIGNTINTVNLKNFNEFINDPDLIGIKNGETTFARQTIASVWNIHTKTGDVPVAIIILDSENRKSDTEILVNWLKDNFNYLKP